MAIPTSYRYAIPTSDKYKEYARYAAHCLNMVAATKHQESRAINRRGFNFPAHRNLRVSEGVENLLG